MWDSVAFVHPFCYTLDVELVNDYCYYCLKKITPTNNNSAIICTGCKFAKYCNLDCQNNGKSLHDDECVLLQKVYPNVPHSLVLFYSRLARYLKKNNVNIIEEDPTRSVGQPRKWAHLLSHMDKIIENQRKFSSADVLYQMTTNFLRDTLEITKDEFLYMFCKKNINSYGIFNNFGVMIGEAMDFEGSAYDHSCRPTIGISFDGLRTTFRSLVPGLDLKDLTKSFVSYTELAQSKYKRKKELMEKYYFECQCERCLDPEDDKLVSIRCKNETCDEPIVFYENLPPESNVCPKCGTEIGKELVEQGISCVTIIEQCRDDDSIATSGLELYNFSANILHPNNVYLADLATSYMQQCLIRKENLLSASQMGNNSTACLRKCYPKYHKCLALHLLKLAYLNLLMDEVENISDYVDEALTILRIWFGKDYSTCQKLEALLQKISSKSNWISPPDLLTYFKFE